MKDLFGTNNQASLFAAQETLSKNQQSIFEKVEQSLQQAIKSATVETNKLLAKSKPLCNADNICLEIVELTTVNGSIQNSTDPSVRKAPVEIIERIETILES